MAHGSCKDCEKEVDLIVVRDQVVGPEEIICPECKVKRIQAKARVSIEEITKKARELRAARDERLGLFDGREPGTGEKLAKVALLDWQHTKDEDGDFWTAKSTAVEVCDLTTGEAPAQYRIQSQFETNPTTGAKCRMYVLCGDPELVPEDADDVAYLSLEVAQQKCEQIEANALAETVRAKIGATEEEQEAQA